MKHAETLIARVLFLEGKPIVSVLNKMSIGAEVDAQLKSDLAAELGAVQASMKQFNSPSKPAITARANYSRRFSKMKRITWIGSRHN
jgi:bacterioferritin